MDKRLEIIFGGLAGFALLFGASISIIKGGMINLALALILLVPFVFILFIRCRNYWHVLIPIFLVAGQMRIPIYGLQQMTLSLVLLLAATGVLILDRTLHVLAKNEKNGWEDGLILALALILTARLIHDRPGFIALGAAEGGFISSLTFVAASWFYFTAQRVASMGKFTRKQLQAAAVSVFLVGIHDMIKGDRTQFLWRPLGGASFWMLCAMLLTLFITSTYEQRRTLWFYICSLAFMAGAILSGYRSRVFFYLTEMVAVSWFARRVKRNLLVVGVAGIAGLFLVIAVSGEIPDLMRRFMSLFVQVEAGDAFVSGAIGRTDEFRSELAGLAWLEIQRHPWVGSGFGLNVSEAIGVLMTDTRATFALLALARSYHNSILILAVQAGLPAALIFSVVSIVIPFKFAKRVFHCAASDFRTWGMAVFAFWCANMFMLQVNGSQSEYFVCMVLNGYMIGMLRNQQAQNQRTKVKGVVEK
jgi:hypothetical protein